MYEGDFITTALKGQISEYFRDPSKAAFLFQSPDGEEIDCIIGQRFENYILLLQDQDGDRFTISQFHQLLDFLKAYIEDGEPAHTTKEGTAKGDKDIFAAPGDGESHGAAIVRKIDEAVNADTTAKAHKHHRRYLTSAEDVRVLRSWLGWWEEYLSDIQSVYGMQDDQELPKDITYVGWTHTPHISKQSHSLHCNSLSLVNLVDAAAIALSKEIHQSGKVVKMRYHTLRLVYDEEVSEDGEHFDSLLTGSYYWMGGLKTVFGGGFHDAAHDPEYKHLYEHNHGQLEIMGHLLDNMQRVNENMKKDIERVEMHQQLVNELKQAIEKLPTLGAEIRKGKAELRKLNHLRKLRKQQKQEVKEALLALLRAAMAKSADE
ncbi:hypothetical protein BDZ85DRAFT_44346 [Elsinoe ampelina]|uniref:Uncharacterized protein n=1 Tax=Elsinoe ampelina TaxID=302913 RepID=A0A6A6G2F2_9PEZI|nr:hypothetical protein BDZ85DRAFT_44346 [Elsinoe ampelina]